MATVLVIPCIGLLLPVTAWGQLPITKDRPVPSAAMLVDPFIGTGGHGHTFPGACVPNGLVQLSPDTRPDGIMDWDGCSGYHYSDSIIYGFSHTHLSGTGVADLCDVLLMPTTNGYSLDPEEYRSPFRKESETAHAGYYTVHLDRPDVRVELTATARVGVHRYHYPKGTNACLVLDLEHRDHTESNSIIRVNEREVIGERRSSSWAQDQRLFYCIRTSHPMKPRRTDRALAAEIGSFSMTKDGFEFGDLNGEPLIIKVGISAVSMEGARRNLEAEVADRSFDAVKQEAESLWNAKLGRFQIKGGSDTELRIFHTALYHCYVAPYVFNDVDGHYRGMDGEVHHAVHPVYTVFSLWDSFRALHPLMTILEPDMTNDWIRTFLLHYQQSGRLPVWELWGNETDCMIGYHSVSVIADAYRKGIRRFDADLALEAMEASASAEHFGLDAYRKRGFISSEDEAESVSRTLEYAYDDACIAWMADAMGRSDVAKRYALRSRNWQQLYDPETTFFRARRNGGFIDPFDPFEVNFHFTEANAWQYGLFVPHDMARYIALLGGKDELTRKLDALFTAESLITGREQADITGLIGQYAHGNEPSHGFAYLYTLSSRPSSTEVYVDRIMKELYLDSPDGLSGNEDCGQMSAWYVMSAMGIYPISPGIPEYALGKPIFGECTLQLDANSRLVITSEAEAGSRAHVVGITWNGNELPRYRSIAHSALVEGGRLEFTLGPRPGDHPSASTANEENEEVPIEFVPAPIVQATSASFTTDLEVVMHCSAPGAAIEYRINDGPPTEYVEPITIDSSSTIEAVAMLRSNGLMVLSHVVEGRFTQVEGGRTITLESDYANQYAAGGDQALVDGLRGGRDYRTGEWQGYRGQDLIATVDLGRPVVVRRLGLGVHQDQKSWIWYPSEVEFVTSVNGRKWSSTTVSHDVSRESEGAMTMDLWTPSMEKRARYVKIIARNAGPCPDWHPGHGESTWIFADEFLIEAE